MAGAPGPLLPADRLEIALDFADQPTARTVRLEGRVAAGRGCCRRSRRELSAAALIEGFLAAAGWGAAQRRPHHGRCLLPPL